MVRLALSTAFAIVTTIVAGGQPAPDSSLFPSPEPSATATACVVPTPSAVAVSGPKRITISQASVANFEVYNHDGYGSLIVIVHFDGTVRALVPPTRDIDPDLRMVLEALAKDVHENPTIACGVASAIVLIRFTVPDGRISYIPLSPSQHPGQNTTPTPQPTPAVSAH